MDHNSNYWFTAIYTIAGACYFGIFCPDIDPIVALFAGAIAAFIMMAIFYVFYILNK